jgi:hypothetical protein
VTHCGTLKPIFLVALIIALQAAVIVLLGIRLAKLRARRVEERAIGRWC